MLTNLKSWLETTGMKAAEELFKTPPALPYIVFRDSRNVYGSDESNLLAVRNVAIELYSDTIHAAAESSIEALLNAKAYPFTKHREWIPSESFFMTVFEFQTTERK